MFRCVSIPIVYSVIVLSRPIIYSIVLLSSIFANISCYMETVDNLVRCGNQAFRVDFIA